MRILTLSFLLLFTFSVNAEVIRVIMLGTGTPRPSIERFGQSILVESGQNKLLFDVGRGSTIRLNQANIPLQDINVVFFTHLHSDHTMGMADLIFTGWIYQRKQTLQIFGPIGTKHFIDKLKEAFKEDIEIRTQPPENLSSNFLRTTVQEIKSGIIYKKNNLKVTAFNVDHGGGVEHAFGYKIENGKYCIVISGDTNYSENLVSHAKNCDLLIHEIADAPIEVRKNNPKVQGLMNYHTTPSELARILEKTNPRLTLLTHILALGGIKPIDILNKVKKISKNEFNIRIANDLMAVDVKDSIRIYKIDYSDVEKN